MNSSKIKLVIAAAIIAMLGIVGVQSFWIYKSYKTFLWNYKHRVHQAAIHSAKKLEKRHAYSYQFHSHNHTHSHNHRQPRRGNRPKRIWKTKQEFRKSPSESSIEKIVIINNETIQGGISDTNLAEIQSLVISEVFDYDMDFSDSSITEFLAKVDVDSIIRNELENEEVDVSHSFEIISGEPGKDLRVHLNGAGRKNVVVPLFRETIDDYPVFLKIDLDRSQTKLPARFWFIVAASVLFIVLMGWAFWYVLTGLLKQKKISELKTDFINNVTHEFKTPISTISLAADSLNMDQINTAPDQVKHYADVIKQESARMNADVEQILEVAALEKGVYQFASEKINANDLLSEVEARFELLSKEKSIDLKLNLPSESVNFYGDKKNLRVAISNLVDNALKFSPNNSQIVLGYKKQEADVVVSVKDNGMGLPAGFIKHLFKKFSRAQSGDVHTTKGFGLGLSQAAFIVAGHRGKIWAENNSEKGCTFFIKLPINE